MLFKRIEEGERVVVMGSKIKYAKNKFPRKPYLLGFQNNKGWAHETKLAIEQ